MNKPEGVTRPQDPAVHAAALAAFTLGITPGAPFELFPDEYSADQGRTDYAELAKHTHHDAIKAGEGLGGYPSFPPMAHAATAAGIQVIPYFWPLMREDGKAQAHQFVTNASGSYPIRALDLEQGPHPGSHAWNGDASKASILAVMHAIYDEVHALDPGAELWQYGASFMQGKGVSWSELVEGRDWIYAWPPRYSGGGDVRTWTKAQIVAYAELSRYGVPADRLAAVQVSDGIFGPVPHTLPGLNRTEDISVLLAAPQGGEDEMALLDDMDQGSKDQRAGKPIPKGASAAYKHAYYLEQRVAAAAKSPAPGPTSGVSKAELAKHASDGEAHHHHHTTGLPAG